MLHNEVQASRQEMRLQALSDVVAHPPYRAKLPDSG
jgi:hypothetical protein